MVRSKARVKLLVEQIYKGDNVYLFTAAKNVLWLENQTVKHTIQKHTISGGNFAKIFFFGGGGGASAEDTRLLGGEG